MSFEFATAGRIVFGRGCAARIGAEAAQFGRRVFVLTGRRRERWAFLWEDLRRRGMDCERFAIMHEPTVTIVEQAVQMAASAGADVVIGIGGGSVIDAAKAVAAKLPNPGDLLHYLEVIGQGRSLENPSLPCIAVPTTAGTGSEVTYAAMIRDEEKNKNYELHKLPRMKN